MLMRDAEGRKKEASKVKQTTKMIYIYNVHVNYIPGLGFSFLGGLKWFLEESEEGWREAVVVVREPTG